MDLVCNSCSQRGPGLMQCCSLGVYCSVECQTIDQPIHSHSDYVIVAPHVCQPHVYDPPCDKNSKEYAIILHRVLGGFLILSDQIRLVCDQNREQCRNGPLRRRLRELVAKNKKALVIEVHSYPVPSSHQDWPLGSVVLYTHGPSQFEYEIATKLNSKLVAGNPVVNDIAFEASSNGWGHRHVLLELDDANTETDVQNLGLSIKEGMN